MLSLTRIKRLLKGSWFLPLTLADPYFIAIKAGLATSLAAAMSNYVADNPDLVSACFISIVSICPTPLLGLQSSFGQLLNSAIGGAWGLLMRAIGLPVVFGVGVAVGLGIFSSFIARQSNFWVASAFSAYFVQVIDYNGIGGTAKVRVLALSVGSVCALVVNLTSSVFFTKHMLGRRMQISKDMVVRVVSLGIDPTANEDKEKEHKEREERREERGKKLESGGSSNDEYFQLLENMDGISQGVFPVLNTLLGELSSVSTEVKLFRKTLHWLELYIYRTRKLKQFLHLVVQFGYEIQKAREELPFSEHDALCKNTKPFLEFLSQELTAIEISKYNVKEAEQSTIELRMNNWGTKLQSFPVEHIKRVAKDLGQLVEDMKYGTPGKLKLSGAETLLKDSTTRVRNEAETSEPNQFFRNVRNAADSISTN